jgi:hypothetical protein
MNPACATDDHASNRTVRCWRKATKVPMTSDSVASAASVIPADIPRPPFTAASVT